MLLETITREKSWVSGRHVNGGFWHWWAVYVLALAGNGGVVPCSYTAHTPHTSIIMGDVCAMLCYVVCPVWARYGPCEGEVWARYGRCKPPKWGLTILSSFLHMQENWVLHIFIPQCRLEQNFIFFFKLKLTSSNLPENPQGAPRFVIVSVFLSPLPWSSVLNVQW